MKDQAIKCFLNVLKLTSLVFISQSAFADWWSWDGEEQAPQLVQVVEPFIEMRTGPADVYPVVHTAEQDEWLTILRRKTSWIQVKDGRQRQGWVHIEDILLTHDVSGEAVDITAPRFDDFKTRRWEGGLLMGEFDSFPVTAAYLGYWMTENLSAELWGSQVLGDFSEVRILSLNILHQPFPHWRYSPFFSLGAGEAYVKPKETFIQPENTEETQMNVGLGMRFYVTNRYFVRMEVKDYKIFTQEKSNEEAREWKLGLSVFF
ncbi:MULTISPECIES: SH3 domain-containing protein [unclassified Oleiphilus]|uniref:SH3 domain-containing protein n=1 Tax=unclassified Oleiphilus TaxID=2631174 RepID=UPI000AA55C06|nr:MULTISPECIES: SH3 domain-containing protein [unclassified Oleiphilus]